MFYEHPHTLSLWSVHLENKGNLLLPNQALTFLALNQYYVHIFSPGTGNCPSWISGRRNESYELDWYRTHGPLAVEQDALPTALPSPAKSKQAADSAILKDRYDHSLQGLALLQCAWPNEDQQPHL